MPQVGFEPTISAGERPKTYALDRVATGTGEACIGATIILKAYKPRTNIVKYEKGDPVADSYST